MKQLDAENQKLRNQHPERAERFDVKIELEQAWDNDNVTQLTKELKTYEAQLVDLKPAYRECP